MWARRNVNDFRDVWLDWAYRQVIADRQAISSDLAAALRSTLLAPNEFTDSVVQCLINGRATIKVADFQILQLRENRKLVKRQHHEVGTITFNPPQLRLKSVRIGIPIGQRQPLNAVTIDEVGDRLDLYFHQRRRRD